MWYQNPRDFWRRRYFYWYLLLQYAKTITCSWMKIWCCICARKRSARSWSEGRRPQKKTRALRWPCNYKRTIPRARFGMCMHFFLAKCFWSVLTCLSCCVLLPHQAIGEEGKHHGDDTAAAGRDSVQVVPEHRRANWHFEHLLGAASDREPIGAFRRSQASQGPEPPRTLAAL